MAHLTTTKFSAYALDVQENEEGSKFSITQKQVIQNHIAELAEELILLEPDPNDYTKFVQQQSYCKGRIDALSYLLACSDAIDDSIVEDADLRPEITAVNFHTNPFETNQE